MTVGEIKDALSLTLFCGEKSLHKQVTGGYAGDLLSWVMGRAQPGSAWITIMSNPNVAAVALLADVSCILLSENVKPDEEFLKRAAGEGIAVLGSEMDTYALCLELGALIE